MPGPLFLRSPTRTRLAPVRSRAITDANNSPGADTIAFNIPGPGVHAITVTGDGLPSVYDDVTIDGYTQPGASPNTLAVGDNAVILIQIDGGGSTGPLEPPSIAASLRVCEAWN